MEKATYEIVQLNGGHALVNTRDDLLGDSHGVNVVHVEPIAQPGYTGRDLVELHALLAPICLAISIENAEARIRSYTYRVSGHTCWAAGWRAAGTRGKKAKM
jgi:hypothetical protein